MHRPYRSCDTIYAYICTSVHIYVDLVRKKLSTGIEKSKKIYAIRLLLNKLFSSLSDLHIVYTIMTIVYTIVIIGETAKG